MVQSIEMTRIFYNDGWCVWEKTVDPEEKPNMRNQDVQRAANMFLASVWDRFSIAL